MAFGRSVPQHIQQMVIRDYCAKHGMKFLLSATEYVIKDSVLMLNCILNDTNIDGIVFYSMGLMPKRKEDRQRVYESKKDIRFAAESMKLDRELIETTFAVSEYHAGNEFLKLAAQLNAA
jgi:sporadic carbohydrate cluster protein (TIGR04323 family)